MQLHGGMPTPFLDRFRSPEPSCISVNVEQSEQGSVFLNKYNLNTLLVNQDAAPPNDAWEWFQTRWLLDALSSSFVLNTDTRSVLVCSNWGDLAPGGQPFSRWRGSGGLGELLLDSFAHEPPTFWLADVDALLIQHRRSAAGLSAVPVDTMQTWNIVRHGLRHEKSVAHVSLFDVVAPGREVPHWQQPLYGWKGECNIVLLCQVQSGVLRFLVRPSAEPGFLGAAQLAPLQIFPLAPPDSWTVRAMAQGTSFLRVRQSEEGGRFFRSINNYDIRMLPESESISGSASCIWLSLSQIHALARTKGYMTNELRSIISLLLKYL